VLAVAVREEKAPLKKNVAHRVALREVNVLREPKPLARALQSSSIDQAPSGVIFQELRLVLDMHFVVKGIHRIPRSCNLLVNLLLPSQKE
jgi:hypothetical protein